jgi:predicted  nucleic acid-binding Zn-ribbon protein
VILLGTLLAGCLAQQADLLQLRRDVDAKIHKLDQREAEVLRTIEQGKADIERMVNETRARLSQEITVLREEELPVIRGALDKNAYQLSALRTRLEDLDHRTAGSADRDRLQDELKKSIARLDATNVAIKDQMTQFSKSLADFKQALAGLGEKIVQGDQRVHELSTTMSRQTDALSGRVDSDGKATTAHLAEVNKSVTSLAKAIETTGGRFMEKSAEQGRRLDEMAKTVQQLRAQVIALDETLAKLREARKSGKGKTP